MSFDKVFNELCYTRESSIVFNDFLDYVIDQFLINPNVKYFSYDKYSEKEYELFMRLFGLTISKLQEELSKGREWFDVLGYFYEENVQSKHKANNMGQFYTPVDVCTMLTSMVLSDVAEGDDTVKGCYDCACGSSRTLLAHHSRRPKDLCFGWDLDLTSCKMSVINFLLHGVKGSVCHMDSLSREFFDGWKINEFVDYGLPMTIMKVDSERESQIFIGHNKVGKVPVHNNVNCGDDNRIPIKTEQSVLM